MRLRPPWETLALRSSGSYPARISLPQGKRQALLIGVSAETYFSNWTIIRHVADFLESTLSFGNRGFPRERGRPVYFGKQPVG